jgi:Polyketide cyclase / dehydrase and lipid transport
VFAFFADGQNDPLWKAGVKSIRRVGGRSIPTKGGRTWRAGCFADVRVVEFDMPRTIVFEGISGPVRPRGRYWFEPLGPGTRVTFDLAVDLTGIKALGLSGPVEKSMQAEVAGLSRAKAYLEQG